MNRARHSGLTSFLSLRPRTAVALAVLAALSGGVCSPALAQDTTAAPAQDAEGLETVIVNARYFAEDVQSAPMAISAKTGDQLEAANITNVGNLGQIIPNL